MIEIQQQALPQALRKTGRSGTKNFGTKMNEPGQTVSKHRFQVPTNFQEVRKNQLSLDTFGCSALASGVPQKNRQPGANMKSVNQKIPSTNLRQGRTAQAGLFAALVAAALFLLAPAAKAITQLEYLQWMVQLTGDSASFSAESTSADYVQWARSRGMDPTGGWQPDAQLTPEQLAQTLVQLYGLNPRKFGGDFFRILEREGIVIDRSSSTVSRAALANLVDEFGFQSRTAIIARASTTRVKGNNGVGNGEDPPPPGWQNPRNPHFGQPQNDGPGTGPGNPGNKGGRR